MKAHSTPMLSICIMMILHKIFPSIFLSTYLIPWKQSRKRSSKADVSAFLFDLISESVSKNAKEW